MGHKENALRNKTLLNLPDNIKMYRANAGEFWAGIIISAKNGILKLKNFSKIYGLPVGFPDLFGWTTITITPDMIGKKIAIFTAYELKATGRLSKEQKQFRKALLEMGGIFEERKE